MTHEIILCYETKEIRALVRAPISARIPVGYDASFLLSYQPNITYYLPLETRHKLTVREIVQSQLAGEAIQRWIADAASTEIPETDQKQFRRTIEIELRCLHEGNIARFKLRPTEFMKWKSKQV